MPEGSLKPTSIPRLVESVLQERYGKEGAVKGPVVTASWAQSVNGAIATPGGPRVILSSPESMVLTHQLRGLHHAILVGIGTILADDPQLTVRLAQGSSPQPVVLDSSLRFPISARLLSRTDHAPWIFHSQDAPKQRAHELERRGARLFAIPAHGAGLLLEGVLRVLAEQGIPSLMVEGGARVLRSFILGRFVRQAVVTASPIFLEGVRLFGAGIDQVRYGLPSRLLDFVEMSEEKHGSDIVVWVRFPLSMPLRGNRVME